MVHRNSDRDGLAATDPNCRAACAMDIAQDQIRDPNNGGKDKLVDYWKAAVESPDERISELPLLTETETRQLLVEWNATDREYPEQRCLHELFEAQAEQTPDAVAIVFGDKQLSYRRLNERANRLAHHLRELGVGRETLVGVCLERSLDMVVGVLAVLKAGGAYVPLDPRYPLDRLGFILSDSKAPVLLTQQSLLADLPQNEASAMKIVCLDAKWRRTLRQVDTNPSPITGPENLAYVIYTSGSTGRPKGVAIEHRALVNFLVSMRREPGLEPSDVLLSVTTLSFDIAGLEIYLPLLVGAKVIIAEPGDGFQRSAACRRAFRDWGDCAASHARDVANAAASRVGAR